MRAHRRGVRRLRPVRRLHDRRRRHRADRARPLGPPVERDGRRTVHAAVPRPRRRVRVQRARGRSRDRPEPVPVRADGDPRRRRVLGGRPRRDRHHGVVPERPRDEELLLALPRDPGRQHPGPRARRRRRLRAEDVRVPRGVRRRPRRPTARRDGQVDRGPAREPDRGRALPQRARQGPARDRRRPRNPGDRDRARRRRRRVPALPRDPRPDAPPRAVQDPASRLLDDDGLDQHDGQGRVPRPVDVRDDGTRDGDRPCRAASSASTRSSCGA